MQVSSLSTTRFVEMGFTYVIGEFGVFLCALRSKMQYITEHMEEDENTSRAIPKWVELEYSVSRATCELCLVYID